MTIKPWSGRAVTEARTFMARYLPSACGQCGQLVTTEDEWVVGHTKARATHPELTWDTSNWRIEHKTCSNKSAQSVVIEKAKADALREVGLLPGDERPGEPPLLPVSLPGSTADQFDVPERLLWSPEALEPFPWLHPFLEVPANASPPLAMTPPHPDAVGSYGEQAIEWIRKARGITLRFWQQLAMTRQLEHREDGSLCWRYIVESAPRRAGKSERLRSLALWRMEHGPDLFEPRQTVVHVARDLGIAREVQEMAWDWCEAQGWTIVRANGKEKIQNHQGSRWLLKGKDRIYGFDGHCLIADECWDLIPRPINSGAIPSMRHRISPQLVMTSTANVKCTSLMPAKIEAALLADDGWTLLLLWAATKGADPADPDTWRSAAPYWVEEEDLPTMTASYREAEEKTPTLDDPDPLASWAAENLNIWPVVSVRAEKGEPVTDAETWAALEDRSTGLPVLEVDHPDFRSPDAVAIESWFNGGVSVASAWRIGDEDRAVVDVADYPDLPAAVAALDQIGFKRRVIVGASLMDDAALRNVSRTAGKGRTGAVVQDLGLLLTGDKIRHSGGEHLTGQVLSVRTAPGADGPRIVSNGRADAVKAAVWAVNAARKAKRGGLIVATL